MFVFIDLIGTLFVVIDVFGHSFVDIEIFGHSFVDIERRGHSFVVIGTSFVVISFRVIVLWLLKFLAIVSCLLKIPLNL